MDSLGIINNIYSNPVVPSYSLLILPNILTYNPYVVTFSMLIGLWYLEIIFDLLLWQYIRPYRNQVRSKLRCSIKKR